MAPGIPIVLTKSYLFEQRWMSGRIKNPVFNGVYFYGLSKSGDGVDTTQSLYANVGDIDTLDPALAYDTNSADVLRNVYETLVFYEGEKTDSFLPQLAESWDVSVDGLTWTFHIRDNVYFHNGAEMTATDVAYSFQRGILQGADWSPQWLMTEPILGVGVEDITGIVDGYASLDDRASLQAADPSDLLAACATVKTAIEADDTAGTVTFHLYQPWGPFLATIANTWGSVMDKAWVIANGGWGGECSDWQNYYAMESSEDPFTGIANGTGPYELTSWENQTITITANAEYWRTTPAYEGGPSGIASIPTAIIQAVYDETERYNMLLAGTADFAAGVMPVALDLVGETCVWDDIGGVYGTCSVDNAELPLRLYSGRPNMNQQDVILYNFDIQ